MTSLMGWGSLIRSTWLLYRMHLWSVLRSRRAMVSLLLAAIPPAITYVVTRVEPEVASAKIVALMGTILSLQVVTPILALVAGSAVVTEEIENRTITYVFTRPIHRAALFLGRWLATLTLVALLLGLSAMLLIAFAQRGEGDLLPGMGTQLLVASLFGGALYSLIFAALGVFVRRPMIVGLGYAFAFELLVANVPGSTQALSVQHYLRSIVVDKTAEVWQDAVPFIELVTYYTPAEASVRLALALIVAAVVGAVGISRRQYVLTA